MAGVAFHVGMRNASGRKADGRVIQIGQQMNPKKPDWLIEEEEDRKRTYMIDDVISRRDQERDEPEDES
jgi:hypothetical protein